MNARLEKENLKGKNKQLVNKPMNYNEKGEREREREREK